MAVKVQWTIDKKYCIKYIGVFEKGYVKYHFSQRGKTVDLGSDYEAKKWSTKFRFKWVANFCCWILNKSDKNLRTFKVVDFVN